jgi:hypothetical protein
LCAWACTNIVVLQSKPFAIVFFFGVFSNKVSHVKA